MRHKLHLGTHFHLAAAQDNAHPNHLRADDGGSERFPKRSQGGWVRPSPARPTSFGYSCRKDRPPPGPGLRTFSSGPCKATQSHRRAMQGAFHLGSTYVSNVSKPMQNQTTIQTQNCAQNRVINESLKPFWEGPVPSGPLRTALVTHRGAAISGKTQKENGVPPSEGEALKARRSRRCPSCGTSGTESLSTPPPTTR